MSKGTTGLFQGTKGEVAFHGDAEDVIALRSAGLDLREHPLQMKQLGKKMRDSLKKKINQRTATREEYRRYKWDERLRLRRKAGVDDFYAKEADRIASGQKTTRNWSEEQKVAILSGEKPKFQGRTMEAHHAYSVSRFPHLANRGEIIYPATYLEHRKGWHGGNTRKSLPGRRIRRIHEF